VELSPEPAARRQAEIVSQLIENGLQRPGPPTLVDLDAALGDFLRVANPAVQKRLLASPEPCGPAQQVQLLGLILRHREAQIPDPTHVQVEIVRWRRPLGAERTGSRYLSEACRQSVTRRHRHVAL